MLELIANTECGNYRVDWNIIVRALDSIAKTTNRDHAGVSILIIRVFVFGCPDAAVSLFSNLFQHMSLMQSFVVEGIVYGKVSKFPAAEQTRAILPLPSILVVADAIVATILNEYTDAH